MNYAIIDKSGFIVNVAISSEALEPNWIPDESGAAQIGGSWNGTDFLPPPPPDYAEINKEQAQQLLQQTDWTATVDISNPQYSNPYLGNQDAFLAYRSQVRQIAVNPPETPAVFPVKPDEIWVTV